MDEGKFIPTETAESKLPNPKLLQRKQFSFHSTCLLYFSRQQDVSLILCTISRAYPHFFLHKCPGRAIVQNEVSHPAARMMSFPFCVNGGGSFTVEREMSFFAAVAMTECPQNSAIFFEPCTSLFLSFLLWATGIFLFLFQKLCSGTFFPQFAKDKQWVSNYISYSCCSFFPPRRTLATSGPLSRVWNSPFSQPHGLNTPVCKLFAREIGGGGLAVFFLFSFFFKGKACTWHHGSVQVLFFFLSCSFYTFFFSSLSVMTSARRFLYTQTERGRIIWENRSRRSPLFGRRRRSWKEGK